MTNNYPNDLNAIRDAVLAARNKGQNQVPSVSVNNKGLIVQRSPDQAPEVLSKLPPQRFASEYFGLQKMPSGTQRWTSPDGTKGLLWSICTEVGDRFVFFTFKRSDGWQSLVVEPAVERHFQNPETGHLFSDGRLCFGEQLDELEEAYAKTVLWANGFAILLRTGVFPW